MPIQVEKDSGDTEKYIRGVHGVPEENGTCVRLHWEWPRNSLYDYCFVFTVTEADEKKGMNLEKMLAENRPREIICQNVPRPYTVRLRNTAQRVYFYPARLQEGGYCILDQKKQNCSEYLRRRLDISYRVTYKKLGGFLSGSDLQQAVIQLSFSQEDKPDAVLVYRCRGGGRDGRRYGIDISEYGRNAVIEVVLGRKETIFFEKLPADLEGKLSLRQAN